MYNWCYRCTSYMLYHLTTGMLQSDVCSSYFIDRSTSVTDVTDVLNMFVTDVCKM